MIRRLTLHALLLLCAAAPLRAQDLDPQVAAQLDAAVAEMPDATGLDQLFRAAVLAHGDTGELLAAVRTRLAAEPEVDTERGLRRLEVWLLRRRGEMPAALGAVERLLKLEETADAVIDRARLLDATGRRDEALAGYAHGLELLAAGDPREVDLRLRMALLSMETDDETSRDALADFAKDSDDLEMANRAAVVLALLGRPKEAIDLFSVEGEGAQRFRQEIRVAEWALDAGEPEVAQEFAWRAVGSATLDRDRWYSLTVLVEAHRADESLDRLIERFAAADELDEPSRSTWIALLRETERFDEAVALFRSESEAQGFPAEMRRELLEMYREAGREQEMIDQYLQLMAEEPFNWLWPEGLARFYLERGDTAAARALWTRFVEEGEPGMLLIAGAEALMGLGQDDLAERGAERCIEDGRGRYAAYLFLFDMHRFRGELVRAEQALDRMHAVAPENAPERMQLAESYERIGNLRRAVEVLEALRAARGADETGEDLEMRLAWLLSEVGDEDLALVRWRELWLRVDSIPRRRYIEDRMMTIAARLGKLADIAIELERRLYAGEADDRDSGLLVRLYTKVGDPVSATEIIEEHLKHSGGSAIDALQEKARVFLACTDYHNYEGTIRELIAIDPEGEADYLRQIAMSMLERGKPEQARGVLARLKELELENSTDSFEFEAGVLALAGMRPEAVAAYRRGLAEVPDRIESYLLMADLMAQTGQAERAVGMFQYLAESADKDDLFTIAIDGLLNLQAPEPVMQWARRITLERLARRHDKIYLYQLLNDLGEEVGDMEARYAALDGQLPIAGDRRSSVVRELMDLAAGSTTFFGRSTPNDPERHLAYGRRLIGLGQLVPPQVYLDLGRVFLDAGDVANAVKTFRLARDLPDFEQFQRDTATLFEEARYLEEALDTYRKVLIGDAGNVGLLVKVAELEEQLGDDAAAADLYVRSLELLLARRPLTSGKEEAGDGDAFSRWFARNVDDFDRYYERALTGALVTVDNEQAAALLARHAALLDEELDEALRLQAEQEEPLPLARYPRVARRADFLRRIALGYRIPAPSEQADLRLLGAFPQDGELLETVIRARVRWGMIAPARELLAASGRPEEELRTLRFLVGDTVESDITELVPLDEALRLILPLLTGERTDEARALLRRVDFAGASADENSDAGALFSAAIFLQDPELTLYLGRNWIRMLMTGEQPAASYQLQPVLDRCTLALDGELLRSLYQYYAQLILEDPERRGEHLRLIPALQERLEVPLFDAEQLADLIAENGRRLYFTMGTLLRMAPAEERAGLASTVWGEVPPTMRTYFLFNLITDIEEPLGDDLAALVREWFAELLQDADEDDFRYQLDSITEPAVLAYASDLVLDVLDLVQARDAANARIKALRALALWRIERRDEALALAVEVMFDEQLKDGAEYYYVNARRELESEIFPDAPEVFLARLDALDAELGADVARTRNRLALARRLQDPARTLAESRRAAQLHPEDLQFRQQLRGALIAAGETAEADALLAAMVEEFPDDVGLAQLTFRLWDGRRHAPRAASALDRWQSLQAEQGDDAPEAQASASGAQAIRIASSTGLIAISTVPAIRMSGPGAASAGDDDQGRVAPATVERLKEAVDAEDYATAQSVMRRMWRSYPNDNNPYGVMYYPYGMVGGISWPVDNAEETAEPTDAEKAQQEVEQRRRARGGLLAYDETVAEQPERADGYEVLAAYDFAVEEMERRLRANGPTRLESMAPVINGLAQARVRRDGAQGAIDGLIAAAVAGEARKTELLQLLALLEQHPEAIDVRARAVLDDLERSLHPRDGAQLLRLARVMAASGARERSVDIYRWCATQTSASRYFSSRQDDLGSIQLEMLVTEVRETLGDGPDMVAVIEDVLRYSAPVQYPWEREQHQLLQLETWSELLTPAEALQRCAEIVAQADSREQPLRRNVADRAALLYAQAGEVERGIGCLEAAICSFDAGAFDEGDSYWSGNYRARSFTTAQYRRFLDSGMSEWGAPAAWSVALGNALLDWAEAERTPLPGALRGAALAALRAQQNGDLVGAQVLIARAAALAADDADAGLWVADAARLTGDTATAEDIERRQLDARTLNVHRIADVVRSVLAEEGAEAALALGATLRDYTLHPELLAVLEEAATAVADGSVLEDWQALTAQASEAQARIDAWREEQRRKAEEAKAASTR